MKKLNLKKGFTLIELLVVVAILGILMAISMVVFTDYRARARDSKIQSQLKQVATQVNLYNGPTGTPLGPTFALDKDAFVENSQNGTNQDIFHLQDSGGDLYNSAYLLLTEMPGNTALYYAWDGVHPNLGGKYFIATSSHKGAFCIDFNGNIKSYNLEQELVNSGGYTEDFFKTNVIFEQNTENYLCK